MTAWDSPSHAPEYDYLSHAPRWLRRRFYDRYPEMQALPDDVTTIMEVGCATGEVARYLLDKYPGVQYMGYDVSKAAIALARAKTIHCTTGRFQEASRAQLVFCRDVVHHQDDPWQFLTDLYQATETFLIVRLRTHAGPPENQGQWLYGERVNYWVLNEGDVSRWISLLSTTGPHVFLFDKDEPPVPLWMRVLIWFYRVCM